MLKSILVGTSLLAASLMLGSCGEKAEKAQEPAAFSSNEAEVSAQAVMAANKQHPNKRGSFKFMVCFPRVN